MRQIILAKRYAKAIFTPGKENGAVDVYAQTLRDLADLFVNPELGVADALTNPLCFEPAIAPHIAAAEAGIAIAVPDLVAWYARATSEADLAIVEGAGGWRVPLHPAGFLSDLPEQLGLDVLLVVGLRLGCLNHARLTLEAIERSGRCRCVGWIGNRIDPGFARLDDNLATLARLLGGPPLAVIPPLPAATAAAMIEHLDHPALARILGLST